MKRKMDDDLYGLSPVEENAFRLHRERSDKISKLMGQYLLKGYRMLGSTCNKCQTILMQDRSGENYCVGCSEVDINTSNTEQKSSSGSTLFSSSATVNHSSETSVGPKYFCRDLVPFDVCRSSVSILIDEIRVLNNLLRASHLTTNERLAVICGLKNCYKTIALVDGTFLSH